MEREIKLICNYCKKDFTEKLSKYAYNQRIKKINNNQKIYCSVSCGLVERNKSDYMKERIKETQTNKSCPQRGRKGKVLTEEHRKKISETRKQLTEITPELSFKCKLCFKRFFITEKRNEYLKKLYGHGKLYCSHKCYTQSNIGKITPLETRMKISRGGMGISKQRIFPMKTISNKVDWNIVINEAKKRGITKYAITKAPIPDLIYLENNKLIALELEKKPLFSVVKQKMNYYSNSNLQHHTAYDKVILVWYDLEGNFKEEWSFENNIWSKVS